VVDAASGPPALAFARPPGPLCTTGTVPSLDASDSSAEKLLKKNRFLKHTKFPAGSECTART